MNLYATDRLGAVTLVHDVFDVDHLIQPRLAFKGNTDGLADCRSVDPVVHGDYRVRKTVSHGLYKVNADGCHTAKAPSRLGRTELRWRGWRSIPVGSGVAVARVVVALVT